MTERLKVGALFAGIGGLELGLEWAGFEVVWQVEIDPRCRERLAVHWPNVERSVHDVREANASNLAPVDLICGGFPCQPFSVAGKRTGEFDERWMWPDFARIIRELRPRYVLVENVSALLRPYEYPKKSGNWNPAPIEAVVGDLAAIGYDAEWDCIPALAVGAPHIRDRVWIVAYPAREPGALAGEGRLRLPHSRGIRADVPDAGRGGRDGRTDEQGADADAHGRRRAARSIDVLARKSIAAQGGTRALADSDLVARRARGAGDGVEEPRGRHARRGGERTGDMADTGSERRERRSSEQGTRRQAAERSEARGDSRDGGEAQNNVADADDAGREERRRTVAVREELAAAQRGGEGLADAESQRVGSGLRTGEQEWLWGRRPSDSGGEGFRIFGDRRGIAEFCRRNLDGWWATEPSMGRVAHGIPDRVDRLKGLGNAVVPQVPYYVGAQIQAREEWLRRLGA